MQQIPAGVREYLSSNDSLFRAQLFQSYPNLRQTLDDPRTHAAVLDWLASEEAWADSNTAYTMNCLQYLRVGASEDEAPIIKPFLLHPDPTVRLRVYEFLLTLYFPDKNREAMFLLLHSMLSDANDTVRAEGAGYIKRANAAGELKDFLQRWLKTAQSRGWAGTESAELVERLLNQ